MANEKQLDKKYFKLGDGKTMFWDPAQPKEENRKLLPGEVKMLEQTKRVQNAKRGEHIVAADEEDIKRYKDSLAAAKQVAEEKPTETATADNAGNSPFKRNRG